MKPTALSYYGGKSPLRSVGTASWIRSIIGYDTKRNFIEPFGGMAGVLLSGPEAQYELINDLNKHIVIWWKAVRDEPERFYHMIKNTPVSRHEFNEAHKIIQDPPDDLLTHALAVHVVLSQSYRHATPDKTWDKGLDIGTPYKVEKNHVLRRHEFFEALRNRVKNVSLECKDAIEVIEWAKRIKRNRVMIYMDPPYYTSYHKAYGHMVDIDSLRNALLDIPDNVQCAISGYGDEWDCLGWEVHAKNSYSTIDHNAINTSARVEKLWVNFTSNQLTIPFES